MKQTWQQQKENLLEVIREFPASTGDALDAAYLAGLEASKE